MVLRLEKKQWYKQINKLLRENEIGNEAVEYGVIGH